MRSEAAHKRLRLLQTAAPASRAAGSVHIVRSKIAAAVSRSSGALPDPSPVERSGTFTGGSTTVPAKCRGARRICHFLSWAPAPGHHRQPIPSQLPPAPPAPAVTAPGSSPPVLTVRDRPRLITVRSATPSATAPGSSPPVPAASPVGSLSPAWGGARFPEGPAETFLGRGGLQGCHAQRESDAPGRPSLPPHRRQAASFSGAIFVQFPRRFSTVARVA